jgi:hypothetical protein
MRRRSLITTLAATLGAVGVIALSGCSSSSDSGEAGKSADQIYRDTLTAMGQVDHVRIIGTQTSDTGTTQVTGDVTQNTARIEFKQGSSDDVVVVTGGKAYVSQRGSPYQEAPPDLELQAQSATLSKTVACAQKEHGKLTKGAVSTVKGVRVIAVNDDGKAPGAAPSITYIAIDGPARVIENKTTGRTTSGGSAACGHSPQDTTSSSLDDYDYRASLPPITPPPGAGSSGTTV